MRNIIALALLLTSLCVSGNAFAYSSNVGADPVNGNHDVEYRVYKKSTTAGFSDAIAVGDLLSFSTQSGEVDGYTMTKVGENTALDTNLIACVALDSVATGDLAYHRCQTKGFVDFLKYDATTAIVAGQKLCALTGVQYSGTAGFEGKAGTCAACQIGADDDNNCRLVSATANSAIISLEAKASGSGSNLKAILNLK
jgi:hypothetical protein